MNTRRQKREYHSGPFASTLAFWTITFMHDNPLLPLFKNPSDLLEKAGLKLGQTVLEVGCGPGFFTIPAAKMVGDEGLVYAVDINPLAVQRVQEKIERQGVKNVIPLHRSAADTGLSDRSIDLAFILGTLHFSGGVAGIIAEMHRVLKPGGILSFEMRRRAQSDRIVLIEDEGFAYAGRRGKILLFTKSP
jgi:ubiquinone/menaquinone biosynthesis C-methylase UbiE